MEKHKKCCFIGYREVTLTKGQLNRIKGIIEHLITKENFTLFLFGSKSEFGSVC